MYKSVYVLENVILVWLKLQKVAKYCCRQVERETEGLIVDLAE